MSRGKRLTENKFKLIAKDLRNHPYLTQHSIAESHHVSTSSVNNVDNYVTWRNFKEGFKPNLSIRDRARRRDRIERAKSAGLKPVSIVERREERATKRIAEALNNLDKTPTRGEFRDLEARVSIVNAKAMAIAGTPFIGWIFRGRIERAVQALSVEGN